MLDHLIVILISAICGIIFSKKFLQKVKIIVEKPDESYVEALNAIIDKDYLKAQKLLMDTVDINPNNNMAYQRLGELKYNKGNYAKSLKIFEMITMRGVISPEELINAYKGYGKSCVKLNKFEKAIEIYNKILDISSNDVDAMDALVSISEATKEWDNALKYLKMEKNINEKNFKIQYAYLLNCKAEEYLKKGNLKEAQKIVGEAKEYDDNCIPAYITSGDIFYADNDIKDAINEWMKILKINILYGFTIFKRLERAYFECNEYEKMISIYENIIKDDPKNAFAHASLGDVYFNMGDYPSAIPAYKDALSNGYITAEIGQNLFKMVKEQNRLEDFFTEIEGVFSKSEKDTIFTCNACHYNQQEFFWKCKNCNKIIYI